MTKPYFKTPIPFVLPPADKGEPFHPHNHQPSITWCPNGDLLAIWYSTGKEQGTELTVLASRLRLGADAWEPSSEFFKAPNRNMHGSSVFHDGKGTIYHFNGMAPDGGRGWAKLALLMRTSRDNGVTWTAPQAIGSRQTGRHQVISGTLMTSDGVLIQNCDAAPGGNGGTALHISHDGGRSWSDPGESKPKPKFAEGGKGEGTIAGIHAKVVELSDGRLLAFGRGDTINGRMPMSISSDLGKTWSYHTSPFPPIGGGQRLVLKRLQEGALLFVSFTSGNRDKSEANGMTFMDPNGREFTGHGMFAAVSFDDGRTWPVRKLLTPGEGKFNGGAWTGDFIATATHAEHAGYLAATQTHDGIIHLISSRLHYRFNLAWLKSGVNDMIARTLIVSEAEEKRLRRLETKGLVTIKPVALPAGRYLKGDNLHLGWPVGIKIGQTLLCAYHQTLRHHGRGPRQDANSSDAVIVRSTDGGETWSDPVDVRQFGTNNKAMVLNFGNCFAVLGKKVFLATKYGLYRSADEGKTWTLLPDTLTQEQTGHKYKDNFGPRMIVHPNKGLVVAVGVERSPCIAMYSSKDEGYTWRHERFRLSDKIHPLEPTAMYHEGRLIFLTRNHTLPFKWHHQIRTTQRPAMMVSETGWFPMRQKNLTNISSYRWPDTTDVDL